MGLDPWFLQTSCLTTLGIMLLGFVCTFYSMEIHKIVLLPFYILESYIIWVGVYRFWVDIIECLYSRVVNIYNQLVSEYGVKLDHSLLQKVRVLPVFRLSSDSHRL